MKKHILIVVTMLLLTACSGNSDVKKENASEQKNNDQYFSYLDDLDPTSIELIEMEASYAIDISDINQLKNKYDHVFIGTIDSIDGCSATIGNDSFVLMPKTYGELTVLKDIQGSMPLGKVTYARPGGTISIANYEKDAPKEMVDNDNKRRVDSRQHNIDKENIYFDFKVEQDIKLEAGKTYLFFGTFYDSGVFSINGAQYGTREIKQEGTNETSFRSLPDENSLLIINNDTNEFETLHDLLEKYF